MNITLTFGTSKEFSDLVEVSGPNKMEYCLRHKINLDMYFYEEYTYQNWPERNQKWKDSLVKSDWLWFMGSDTLIMNQTIDVRKFLNNDYDFIVAIDVNNLNNDSCFLQNTPRTLDFLDYVIQGHPRHPYDLQAMLEYLDNSQLPENQRSLNFMELIRNGMGHDINNQIEYNDKGLKVLFVHQRQFNSYDYKLYHYSDCRNGQYQEGDFVLHFPGLHNPQRIPIMKEYLKKVIR